LGARREFVPRLSIVVPATSNPESLEKTLVSVLENRPADCELIVVLAHAYDDPYDLAGEVEFVEAGPQLRWDECANAGLARSRADVVHFLSAGAVVSVGWAELAMSHFDDVHVAAVSPVVRSSSSPFDTVLGVHFRRGGWRRIVRASTRSDERPPILGPVQVAGFYRREALQLAGGFCCHTADAADVDLGLTLARLGYCAAIEPRSVVIALDGPLAACSAFRRGLELERVFWRHVRSQGVLGSLAAHAMVALAETASVVVRPSHVLRLAGRLVGAIESPRWRSFHRALDATAKEAAQARLQANARAASRDLKTTSRPRKAA
jgi:hypothetical protein